MVEFQFRPQAMQLAPPPGGTRLWCKCKRFSDDRALVLGGQLSFRDILPFQQCQPDNSIVGQPHGDPGRSITGVDL